MTGKERISSKVLAQPSEALIDTEPLSNLVLPCPSLTILQINFSEFLSHTNLFLPRSFFPRSLPDWLLPTFLALDKHHLLREIPSE